MKLQQMSRPLPTDVSRCVGSKCDQKNICQRYLTIEIDSRPYQWFMDASVELNYTNDDACDFLIPFGGE
jgi:hypothetical protein